MIVLEGIVVPTIFKTAGVYQITNSINRKFYVGSSVDIDSRWRGHRSSFKKPMKHRSLLWAAVRKYGIENFTFLVLEECEPIKETLLAREQHYIDTLKPEYNLMRKAGSRLGSKQSAETIRKAKEALKRWHDNMTDEQKAERRASLTGVKHNITEEGSAVLRQRGRENSSVLRTPEVRAKAGASLAKHNAANRAKGIPHHMTGRSPPDGWSQMMSEKFTGRESPMKGRNHSDETKEKLREIFTGRDAHWMRKPWSPERRAAHPVGLPAWNKGRAMTPEAKAKMIATKKARREASIIGK